MPILNNFRQIQLSNFVDTQANQVRRVSKILGYNKPMYTLPHIQWQNHLSSLNTLTNKQLMNVRRYIPLKITK